MQSGAGYATSKAARDRHDQGPRSRTPGPHGVRVNCVNPGFIEAGMSLGISPEDRERTIAATPLGRPGTADEVADGGPLARLRRRELRHRRAPRRQRRPAHGVTRSRRRAGSRKGGRNDGSQDQQGKLVPRVRVRSDPVARAGRRRCCRPSGTTGSSWRASSTTRRSRSTRTRRAARSSSTGSREHEPRDRRVRTGPVRRLRPAAVGDRQRGRPRRVREVLRGPPAVLRRLRDPVDARRSGRLRARSRTTSTTTRRGTAS